MCYLHHSWRVWASTGTVEWPAARICVWACFTIAIQRAAQMLAEFYKAKTLDLDIDYTAGGI
jgi:hypothetical protein